MKLVINRSYIDQIRQITEGKVDISYMGPTPYLRAQDNYLQPEGLQLQLIAAEAQGNVLAYQSVLVTRQDSGIQSLEQVKGRTVAFGAPHSFSSHYVPRYLLQNANIDFAKLKDYAFLNRHEKVALAVLHGDFDVGGLRKQVAERYVKKPRGLRIIAESSLLPPHVIVARPKLDKALVEQIRQALFNSITLDKKALDALGKDTKLLPVTDDAFQEARKIVNTIENTQIQVYQE